MVNKSAYSFSPTGSVLSVSLNSESLTESCELPDLVDGINETSETNIDSSVSEFFANSCYIDLP